MNKIYTLWKLKEGYDYYFGSFTKEMLGTMFEKDYEFASLEIGGAGLNGTYIITREDRENPIIIFRTKQTSQKTSNRK